MERTPIRSSKATELQTTRQRRKSQGRWLTSGATSRTKIIHRVKCINQISVAESPAADTLTSRRPPISASKFQHPGSLRDLLARSTSSFYAPLTVTQIAGKGRGVIAAQDFSPGELLLASSPLALVEAVPDYPAGGDPWVDGSYSNSGARSTEGAFHLPQPGAGDLVRLLAGSRLTKEQSQRVAALFSGEDPAAGAVTRQASHAAGPAPRSHGRDEGLLVQQLEELSPPHQEGVLRAMLLPSGELRPAGRNYQGGGVPLEEGAVQPLVANDLGLPSLIEARLAGAVLFNCYGEPAPEPMLDELLQIQAGPASRRPGEAERGGPASSPAAGVPLNHRTGGEVSKGAAVEDAAGGGGGGGSCTEAVGPGCGGGQGVRYRRGGFVGLWPDYAMLNHSCCPNTINLVGGPHHHMVVRTTEPVRAGDEVTVCYFGRELLAPRSVRAAATRRTHGFECGCARCRFELSLGPRLESELQRVYDRVNEGWGPSVSELAAALETATEALLNLAATAPAVAAGATAAATGPDDRGRGQGGAGSAGSAFGIAKGGVGQLLGRLVAFGATLSRGGGGSGEENAAAQRELEQRRRARAAVLSVVRQLEALDEQVSGAVAVVEEFVAEQPNRLSQSHLTAAVPRHWVRASLYDALELRLVISELLSDAAMAIQRAHRVEAAGGGGDVVHDLSMLSDARHKVRQAAEECLAVVEAVGPGTNLHIRLASQIAREAEYQDHSIPGQSMSSHPTDRLSVRTPRAPSAVGGAVARDEEGGAPGRPPPPPPVIEGALRARLGPLSARDSAALTDHVLWRD